MSAVLDAELAAEQLCWSDLTAAERNSVNTVFKALRAEGSDPAAAARMALEAVLEGGE